ncbi:g3977 [Coccomyxa elongata]
MSWEENEEFLPQEHQAPSARSAPALNPNAFSFNPGASTFTPSFAAAPAAPSATPQPPAPTVLQPASASAPHQPASASPMAMPSNSHINSNGVAPMEEDGPAEVAGSSTREAVDVDSAADAVKELTVAPPTPAPSTSESSPQKDKGGGADHEEDDDQEEDQEARKKELQRIHEELQKADNREHMNIVFIGHVDAGKSTTGGQILYLTGGVDERTIQKYEKEAKDKNRESWYMAYIMDTNEEERAKGKTVEVGRALFMTQKKRYTILDAPGHKNYVPNMISGASQADVGVLVVSARKAEFEAGFERGGQTREHAQLAKTLGVAKLILAINKMDDPSIINPDGTWSQERYKDIVTKLTHFLKTCGYRDKDVISLPMSGLLGLNIKDPVPQKTCPWYQGRTLFQVLDDVEPLPRDPLAPFRMSVIDKYKDMGTIAMGKSEAGLVRKGDRLYVMPNKTPVTVTTIYRDDDEVQAALGGENLRLRLSGVDEEDIAPGFVICSRNTPVPCVTYFDAQLQILDLLEHKAVFTSGYKAILHLHSLVEECEITTLFHQIDTKIKDPKLNKKKVKFAKSGSAVVVRIEVEKMICAELFKNVPQLGRFTLRDEGRTIAIGKIIKLPKSLKETTTEAK